MIKKLVRAAIPLKVRRIVWKIRQADWAAVLTGKNRGSRRVRSHIKNAIANRRRINTKEATQEVYRALSIDPDSLHCQHLLADLYADAGRFKAAKGITRQIIEAFPMDVRAIKRLRAMGEKDDYSIAAIEAFDAQQSPPEDFLPILLFLFEAGEFSTLELYCDMAIAKISEDTQAEVAASLYAQRALAIAYQGDHDRSIIAFEDVPLGTAARKRYVSTLATSYLEMGDADKAESALREVYGDGTGYDTPYSSVLLSIYYKTGAIGDAHRLYRSRKTTDIVASYFGKTHPKNVDFKSIRGSAVILSEGGPGDEIRFSTMYGELAEKFDQLAISASPRLLPLLKRSFPEIDFLSCSRYRNEFIPTDISDRRNLKERGLLYFVNDDVAERAFRADHVLTICDTLGDMRTSVRDFTGAPSLIPSPALVDEWRHRTNGTKKQIGLSWRSLLRSSARDRHYLDVQDLEPLSALTDTEFWLAQPGATAEEIEYLRNLVDLKVPADLDLKDDFDGQAAYFAALDAVISPLTATAELAGAVGARTLILSRTHIASWRQQTDGKDVWYGNAVVVTGDPIWDKGSLMNGLISEIVNTPRKRP